MSCSSKNTLKESTVVENESSKDDFSIIDKAKMDKLLDALISLIEAETKRPEVMETRMPAPLNITEIGGYYNLLSKIEKEKTELREKLIKSVLGIPV